MRNRKREGGKEREEGRNNKKKGGQEGEKEIDRKEGDKGEKQVREWREKVEMKSN